MSTTYSRNQMSSIKRGLKKIAFLSRSITVRKRLAEITKLIEHNNDIYETEIQSLQLKNRMLARASQFEKECSKRIGDEKLSAQRAFLDMCKENALLKSDLKEMESVVSKHDQDFKKSLIPNLVQFSDVVTKMMMANTNVLKNIESRRNGINDMSFLRNSWSNKSLNGLNSSQPVSTVNPMIKGCVIQKPTINVRRVSFPDERRNALFSNVTISSPIMEESEELEESLDPIVNVNNSRKCKNGLRHAMASSNRLAIHSTSNNVNLCEAFETSTNSVNLLMEPIVRLQDVTQMLQNSSIQITETDTPIVSSQESNLIGCSPEIQLKRVSTAPKSSRHVSSDSPDNALEGCSWMYQTTSPSPVLSMKSPSCRVCIKNTPVFKVVHNDGEMNGSSSVELSPTKRISDRVENLSPRRSLLLQNCTRRPRRSCRSSIAKTTEVKENQDTTKKKKNSLDPNDTKNIFRLSTRKSSSVVPQENVNNANSSERNNEASQTNRQDTTQMRRRAKLFTRTSPEPDISSVAKESLVEPVSRESTTDKRSFKMKRKSSECNTSNDSLSVSSADNGSRPRRSARKANISYKEPSLACKMRRNS